MSTSAHPQSAFYHLPRAYYPAINQVNVFPSSRGRKDVALPPFRKRKQNTSTTKEVLQQRVKKRENSHIKANIANASATMQP